MRNIFKVKMLVMAVAVAMVLGIGANAQALLTVDIDMVDGSWVNVVGGQNVETVNGASSTDVDMIRWGGNVAFDQKSGYNWASNSPQPFEATVGDAFSLGTFTHLNRVISSGTSIDSVDLAFSIGIFDNPALLTTTFNFDHNETPNSSDPVSSSDIVTITNPFYEVAFNDNGNDYLFSLLGFSQDGGVNLSDMYISPEGGDNTTGLYAIITAAPTTVPEPGTVALLGLGMVGLAGAEVRRRRKTKAVDNS